MLCYTEVRKNFENWYKMRNECMLVAVVKVPVVAASRMICFAWFSVPLITAPAETGAI